MTFKTEIKKVKQEIIAAVDNKPLKWGFDCLGF